MVIEAVALPPIFGSCRLSFAAVLPSVIELIMSGGARLVIREHMRRVIVDGKEIL